MPVSVIFNIRNTLLVRNLTYFLTFDIIQRKLYTGNKYTEPYKSHKPCGRLMYISNKLLQLLIVTSTSTYLCKEYLSKEKSSYPIKAHDFKSLYVFINSIGLSNNKIYVIVPNSIQVF